MSIEVTNSSFGLPQNLEYEKDLAGFPIKAGCCKGNYNQENLNNPQYGVVLLPDRGGDIAVHGASDIEEICVIVYETSSTPTARPGGRPIAQIYELNRSVNPNGEAIFSGYIPELAPGTVYNLQATYPEGSPRRYSDLLVDPYARGIQREVNDNGEYVHGKKPRLYSVVSDPEITTERDPTSNRPNIDPQKRVIYEAHIKGDTILDENIPEELRGTYLGFAHPDNIDRLKRLGVTTVEFLPLQASAPEPYLYNQGKENYWGYSTIGFFAPDERFASNKSDHGAPIREFKEMVYQLHEAGIEVVLDVVYNHNAEGSGGDKYSDLALRGLDAWTYYHQKEDRTGCGNMLDMNQPVTRQMCLDSLRYWATEMGVDGYRFDLATALVADRQGKINPEDTEFLDELTNDPVLSKRLLIAEPWDAKGFPDSITLMKPMHSWNARFRDTVREFFNRHGSNPADLAYALTGSGDPRHSVNFITAHDGMTLRDLVSYYRKENWPNDENNRDGTDDNKSNGHGVHGETEDKAIRETRYQAALNMVTALAISLGTVMMSAGDEVLRTQKGNNNSYQHDNELNYTNRNQLSEEQRRMASYFMGMIAIRQASKVGDIQIFQGENNGETERASRVRWFNTDGTEKNEADWHGNERVLGMFVQGDYDPKNEANSLLYYTNDGSDPVHITLPNDDGSYILVADSSQNAAELAGFGKMPNMFILPPYTSIVLRKIPNLGQDEFVLASE